MKKDILNKLLFMTKTAASIVFCLGIMACRNTNDAMESTKGEAKVKVVIVGSNFEDVSGLGTQALAGRQGIMPVAEQKEEIPLNGTDDYKLVATLTPVSYINGYQASSKVNTSAVTETNPLTGGIMYKVIVYDNTGKYISEQDYISGQNGPDIIGLNGDSTYTFVVYSTGDTGSVPATTYVDPNNKTLAGATVENVSGNSDLMYYTTSMVVSGNNINYLNIVLRHKFSQIITTLDVGNNPTFGIWRVTGVTITPHNSTAKLNLSDGNVTRNGSSSQDVVFADGNSDGTTKSLTSAPVFVNADATTTGTLTIAQAELRTLNAVIQHTNVVLNNLKITPGVKYNLKLTFTTNDKYLTYKSQSAVRINGMIWMRHNLGANTALDPDIPNSALIGNYYQFGRSAIVANAATPDGAISGWNTTLAPSNAWNGSGGTPPPVKTGNDPCPSGYRIPSVAELNILGSNANVTYSTLNRGVGNMDAVAVLTSKQNNVIHVTFPLAGMRRASNGVLNTDSSPTDYQRGNTGLYWTANTQAGNPQFGIFGTNYAGTAWTDNLSKNAGQSIRCIAEAPYN
ncbi:TPA: hypothetical protein NEG48_003069 [Elizabethkingia anophelis]|nr:hypothetical protein [Elizabethkingia anophelis]